MLEEELGMLRQAVRPSREERRERIASEAMCAIARGYQYPDAIHCAERGVDFADALLAALAAGKEG